MNFWTKLRKPILILAPMDDVTDTVFRQIVAKTGRPDVFFTEFTSTDALCSKGKPHTLHRLQYTEHERPLVAQIWGNKPENFYKAAQMVQEMGFDGIDINMGCPVRNVIKVGACSALIQNPKLALEIIQATKEGAPNLPVSVKTRIGFNQIETEPWLTTLLESEIAALTVHGRTVKEQSKVPAHWDEIGKAVQIRNKLSVDTIIIGNGDVESLDQARELATKYSLDGIMIGRGIFHNIWFFDPKINPEQVNLKERLKLLKQHTNLFEATWNNTKPYDILKKFYKIYLSGFEGAAEIRNQFMQTKSFAEVKTLLNEF